MSSQKHLASATNDKDDYEDIYDDDYASGSYLSRQIYAFAVSLAGLKWHFLTMWNRAEIELLCRQLYLASPQKTLFKEIAKNVVDGDDDMISGVDVNYKVPERSGKEISTGTPFRLVCRVIHIWRQQEIRLLTPRTYASTDRPPSLPCGRPNAVDIKYTPLSENSSYNDLLDLKPKLDYNMIVIYLKLY